MAEQSGFFDAHLIDGEYDRVYLAESFAKYFASFIGNGIFGGKSSELIVRQKTTPDMSINVMPGQGWINGYWYENTDELSLAIDIADGVLNRIDLIVLRWNNSERVIRLAVKKGISATNASVPFIQRDADCYELKLAEIYVKAGTVSITQANITDTRLNNEVCGFVHGVVEQFDTTEFGKQIDSFIEQFKTSNEAKMEEIFNELEKIVADNELVALHENVDALNEDVNILKGSFINGILPVTKGGTGASTAAQARANLGAASADAALQFQFNNLDGSVNYNNIITRGIYWVNTWTGTGGSNLPNGQDSGWMIVYAGADRSVTQIYYSYLGYVLRRTRTETSTFGAWEWDNPPKTTGIEYRLTERWNGKVLYQKSINIASLPNKSIAYVDTRTSFLNMISIDGYAYNATNGQFFPFPVYLEGKSVPSAVINKMDPNGFVLLTTVEDMTAYNAEITIKYTKQ